MTMTMCIRKITLPAAAGAVTLLLLLLTQPGCKHIEPSMPPVNPAIIDWQARAEHSRPYAPSAQRRELPRPQAPVREPAPLAVEEKPLPNMDIDLTLAHTEVSAVIRSLAAIANINIIVPENISGTVSTSLTDVPWDQAFRAILNAQGLSYRWEGESIVRILTSADRERELLAAANGSSSRQQQQRQDRIIHYVRLNYLSAERFSASLAPLFAGVSAGGGADSFIAAATASDNGITISADVDSNALILYANAATLDQILSLIETVDIPAAQVLIEATIVETNRDTARQLGVEWSGRLDLDRRLLPVDHYTGGQGDFGVPLAVPNAATLGMTLGRLNRFDLSVQLSALEKQGRLNILSNPSITTLDNHSALIESGRRIPYESESSTLGGANTTNIQWEDAVLKLEVTPHVINSSVLRLDIRTTKDEPDFINGVKGTPTIIKKQARTTVLLHDGQTTVIGGLSQETSNNRQHGVPVLKHLPVIGHLFKGVNTSNNWEDILIFITPHILPARSDAAAEAQP